MLLFTFCSFVIQIQEVEKQVDKLSGLLKKLQVCKFLIQCFVVSADFDYPSKEVCGCGSMKTVKALDWLYKDENLEFSTELENSFVW